MLSLPSTVTHPLIRVKPVFQCIPHDLNIKHDVINSTFELKTFVDNKVMNEFDGYKSILQNLLFVKVRQYSCLFDLL